MMAKPANQEHIDSILSAWQPVIGEAYPGYRNHVVRMATFCLSLRDCNDEEQQKIEIAACFHDIGLWTDNTLDYLEPSVPPAHEYLKSLDRDAWKDEIEQMIVQHHKLRAVKSGPSALVEVFRRGDLVDFSLGMVTFGLPRAFIRQVKREVPNAGFHRTLVKLLSGWVIRHPLRPMPMMRW